MITPHYQPIDGFEFITIDEAKKQLRLDASFTDEDSVLQQCIDAAINAAENYMGRPASIVGETLVLSGNAYQRCIPFSDWRGVKVDSVMALLPDAEEAVPVPADDYVLQRVPGGTWKLVFINPFVVADVANGLVVTVGLAIPAVVKQACLLALSDFYEYREDRNQGENRAFQNLLRPYKKFA